MCGPVRRDEVRYRSGKEFPNKIRTSPSIQTLNTRVAQDVMENGSVLHKIKIKSAGRPSTSHEDTELRIKVAKINMGHTL